MNILQLSASKLIADNLGDLYQKELENLIDKMRSVGDPMIIRTMIVIGGEFRYVHWHSGSHTVNVFIENKYRKEIDCWSIGDFAKNHADLKDFIKEVKNALEEDRVKKCE